MRYLLVAGACIVGVAALFPACSIEDYKDSRDVADAARGVGDGLVVPPGEAQSCTQVDSWVEANHTKLPTDYDELGRLPMPYRRVIFGSLSPATRSALFQTQFERYATEHPDMTAEQQAALQKGRELFTPELYAAPRESPDRQAPERAPLAAFQQQAFAAFGREVTIQLFATIGPEDPAEVPALSASPVEPLGLPVCQCTPSWDLCASNKKCIVGKIPCVRTAFLCGLTMTYACTGICIG